MIQVISRVFKVMEYLDFDRSISLETLTRLTGLNKGTLCNILKSLVEVGYVEKSDHGEYKLGTGVLNLTKSFSREKLIISIGERFSKILAE